MKTAAPKPITIRDIARQMGVSIATVSRVLNGKPDVSPDTRERVLVYIQQLGYVPSALARSLSKGTSHFVGVLVPSLTDTWTLELLRGVSEVIEPSPFNLVLFAVGNAEDARAFFDHTLPMGLLAGLIIVLPPPNLPQVRELLASDFPVILLDDRGDYPNCSSITITNYEGAYSAVRHLLGLGHRRIACLSGSPTERFFHDRLEGYKAALQDAGIPPEPGLIAVCEASQNGAAAAVSGWLQDSMPTAIFAAIDRMAYGALETLQAHGFRVPEDVALVGFDDLPASAYQQPPLTTVKEPMVLMGQTAARMLVEWLRDGGLAQKRVELQTELIIRASCGAQLTANVS